MSDSPMIKAVCPYCSNWSDWGSHYLSCPNYGKDGPYMARELDALESDANPSISSSIDTISMTGEQFENIKREYYDMGFDNGAKHRQNILEWEAKRPKPLEYPG